MRTSLHCLLAASLWVVAGACDGGGGTTFDIPDKDGADVAGDATTADGTGSDGAAPDGAADTAGDAGPTTPPECVGVTCANGGACVVVGGAGACECPPGTEGASCETVCPVEPLGMAACSSVGAPGIWWHGPQAEDCGRAVEFSLSAVGASEVLLSGEFNGWATTAADATALTDADGDGSWEGALVLGPGVYRYKFIVDGVAQADPSGVNEPDGTGGSQTVFEVGECASQDPQNLGCRHLFNLPVQLTRNCDASGGPGCLVGGECPSGCIRDVWFVVDLGARRAVTDLRFRADWWAKRPKDWQVWASDSPLVGPLNGATLVDEGRGQMNPWQCVTGEACSSEVPAEECCPNGVGQPQQVDEGALISKFDDATLTPAAGRYLWFNIVSTYDLPNLNFQGVWFEGNDCIPGEPTPQPGPCDADPCFAGVTCTPVGAEGYSCGPCPEGTTGDGETCVGEDGCKDSPCFAGVVCTSTGADSYTCGACPQGLEGDGETCTEVDGCADSPCFPDVTCTDYPAPDTGFTCGPCPEGFTGNGETCQPVAPPECVTAGDCNPNGTETCSGGKCVVKSCSSQGACGSGYCFKGKCAIGAGSCEGACQQTYGNQTWLCDGSGYCQVRNCSKSKPCGGGQDCVSRFNNSYGPGGSSTSAYNCESAGQSPCGGSCTSSQICSSESEPPKCF